jgi:hypothetical protein
MRTRLSILLSTRSGRALRRAFATSLLVALLVALPVLSGCARDRGASSPSPTGAASSAPSPASSASSPSAAPAMPSGLVALWPFATSDQVRTWQAAYRSTGRQPWHLDVERTAISFAHDHLGYSDLERVTTRSVSGADARIGVGARGEDGRDHTAGVLHLVRFGTDRDAPWVVVGSEDTFLTLTTPRYGATVTSPLTVAGRITGVDESLHVVVVGPASPTPLGVVTGLPAGGENTPWTTRVPFAAPSGTVLTVAVSTGGHLMAVERFAITAVRVK